MAVLGQYVYSYRGKSQSDGTIALRFDYYICIVVVIKPSAQLFFEELKPKAKLEVEEIKNIVICILTQSPAF